MVITIVAAPDGSKLSGISHTLPAGGATIGRNSNNTLTLPDASRIASSNHATITEQQGAFTLVDHSTNGTFLNGAETPVEKGSAIALNKGDIIGIGPYQLSVDFEDTTSTTDNLGGGYLDSLGSSGGKAIDAEPVESPVSEPPVSELPESEPESEDDLNRWLDPEASGNAKDAEPVESPVNEHPVSDAAPDDDLNRWLDPASSGNAPQADWDSPQHDPASASIAPLSNMAESIDPLEMLDNAALPSQPSGNPMIPPLPQDDPEWWKEPQSDSQLEPQPNPLSDSQSANQPGSQPSSQPDNAPLIQHAMPPPVPVAQEVKPEPPDTPAPAASASAPTTAAVKSLADAPGAHIIAQRMGLRDLSKEQLDQLPPAVAEALVQTLSRLMDILRARSNIKNEIRATHTIIGATENNPLKFAAQIDDAMNYMFSNTSAAFMPADKAIDDSFNDLEDHQMATLAGTRAAYEAMLAHFNPAQIIVETGADPVEGRLIGGKKAKAWDAFQKHYGRLISDPEGTYNRLFGEEFALSYEQQVQQLKAMRQQQK